MGAPDMGHPLGFPNRGSGGRELERSPRGAKRKSRVRSADPGQKTQEDKQRPEGIGAQKTTETQRSDTCLSWALEPECRILRKGNQRH